MIFCSSLPPEVCRRVHVLFMLFVFACVQWCPTHVVLCFCFVFLHLVAIFSGLSIFDCPFGILYLFIVFFVFSDKVRGDCLFVSVGRIVDHYCLNFLFIIDEYVSMFCTFSNNKRIYFTLK